MFKKELLNRFLITFIWLILITFLRWNWHWFLIGLWLGGFLGIFLIEIDHFLYVFLSNPHELTSLRVKRLSEQKNFKQIITIIFDTYEERKRLAFHNALFQVILCGLCFFTITSTGNLFGSGLLMVMILMIIKDEINDWIRGREEKLNSWLFWPIKQEVSLQQQRLFIVLMMIIFLFLSFLLI